MKERLADVNRKRFTRMRVLREANDGPTAASMVSPVSHAVARAARCLVRHQSVGQFWRYAGVD